MISLRDVSFQSFRRIMLLLALSWNQLWERKADGIFAATLVEPILFCRRWEPGSAKLAFLDQLLHKK